MKPLTRNGALVDFKEKIIFENEKDCAFASMKQFRFTIHKKYGYVANSKLYRNIVNYQVKTYGHTLQAGTERLTRQQCLQTKKHRMQKIDNSYFKNQLESIEKRVNKRIKKELMKTYLIEKDIVLNCYIVWEVHKNYKVEVFKSRLKRDCLKWVKKNAKNTQRS